MACEYCNGAVKVIAAAFFADTWATPDKEPKKFEAKVCPNCGEILANVIKVTKTANVTAPDNNQEPQKPIFVTVNIPVECICFEDWNQEQLLQSLIHNDGNLQELRYIIEQGLQSSVIKIST